MKNRWLERWMVRAPLYFTLCTTTAQFHAELRRLMVNRSEWPPFVGKGANATTTFLENGNGDTTAIVTIPVHEDMSGVDVAAILVHEATHIKRKVMEILGEDHPSEEFEAYTMQAISGRLMHEYARQTGARTTGDPVSASR